MNKKNIVNKNYNKKHSAFMNLSNSKLRYVHEI